MKKNIGILVAVIATTITVMTANATAQIADPSLQLKKQIAAPVPKLVLKGAVAETKKGVQYHKIVLSITNRDKYDSKMFIKLDGVKLPPNPCSGGRTRVVSAVYDERGTQYAKCIPMADQDSLGEFSFLLEKGAAIPRFIYVVLTDLGTSAAYRSNLLSPMTGATK